MRRRLHLIFALLVLVAGIALRAWDPPIIAEMRFRSFDLWQRIAPRPFEQAPVTVVALDEESLKRIGQWPWPRTVIAKLVTNLQDAGASAIAFDVIYSEADRSSPASLLGMLPDGAARTALEEAVARGEVVDNDEVFAQAIGRGGVVLGFAFAPDAGLQPPDHKAGVSFVGESPVGYVPRFGTAVLPLPELGAAASGLGSLNVIKDNDGIIRRVPLLLAMGDDVYPSLALEALRVAQKAKNILVKVSGAVDAENSGSLTGVQAVRVGKLTIPTTPGGQILLYDAGPQTARHLPAWQVLDGSFDKSRINGHIVFFGATATGLYDAHATPLASVVPGIEQHAQIAEQAILGQFLNRPAWADGAELMAVSVLGFLVLITFFFRRLGARWAALIGFVLAGGGIWVSWWAFTTYHFLLDPLTSAMVGGAVYLTAVVTSFLQSERERNEVRRAFGQYVAPAVVERIAQRPEAINLGGETRPVTLMFCDLRDFTSLSEKLTAPELTKLVNRFLTSMTAAIYETGGTVDKYIGDCVMAFWNAPLDDPAHALNACKAALDMRQRLIDLNAALSAEGGAESLQLRMGIGINSGDCNVGNMGSDQRLAYTAVGDPVNLASRLEGQTKAYKLDCLVSETSAAQSQDLALLPVDRLRVKGRQQPVQIYALLGDANFAREPGFQTLKEKHAAFMTAYVAGDWPAARRALNELGLSAQPFHLEELIKVYSQRLDRLEVEPAPADWDGVFTATEK